MFLLRAYNVVKYPVLMVAMGVLAKISVDVVDAGTISILATVGYWDSIAVTIFDLLSPVFIAGASAGVDKVLRSR